jgi:hypothetical protein
MPPFHLFRIRVFAPEQSSLFGAFNPQVELLRTLERRPAARIRGAYTWHVGNVTPLDDFGVYFALGRTSRKTLEQYDEATGNFVEKQFEAAPYTHVICDVALEVCGIAPKTQLAPSPAAIAQRLETLLNSTVPAKGGHRFEASSISDPDEFILQLQTATKITQFSLTFSRPNPFDVDKDFHAPMEELLRTADGSRGRTSLTGDNLNPTVLEHLTRSVAATGDDASARLVPAEGGHIVRRRLRGNAATVSEDEPTTNSSRQNLLDAIRRLYARIRGKTRA